MLRRGNLPAARPSTVTQAGEIRSSRVESLRALAALAVMVGHVWGTANGYGPTAQDTYLRRIIYGGGYGVFVFFALSGYLLFWPFVRRYWGGGSEIKLGRYLSNRALRILPLYYMVVLLLLIIQEHGGSSGQWLRFMTWTETFSSRTFGTVDGVVWSLVVEVIFYAFLPLLAAALARVARDSLWRACVILLGLGGASCLFYLYVSDWHPLAELWRYTFPATFMFFVPGMLVALMRCQWEKHPPRLLRTIAGSGDIWVLAAVPLWLAILYDYGLTPLSSVACLPLIGACVLPLRPGAFAWLLERRWLAILGIASYSIYLWHIPLIRLVAGTTTPSYGFAGLFVRVAPLTCAVALISYAVIEAPFLRLRRRWSGGAARRTEHGQVGVAPALEA